MERTISKSRNVNGYVRAVLAHEKLEDKLAAKLLALEPLQRKTSEARTQSKLRWVKLTGGQMGEAQRILGSKGEAS